MSKRFYFFVAGGVVVCALVVAGVVVRYRNEQVPSSTFVTYHDSQLSDAERQPFLDKIKAADEKLAGLKTDAPPAERFQVFMTLASEYAPIGEWGKAREYYLQAAKLFPNEPTPWYAVSLLEVKMGDYVAARTHIDAAIKAGPTNPEYWRAKIDLARYNLHITPTEMNTLLADALAATSENLDIVSYKAQYLADQGDLLGAVQAWKLAKERNPSGAAVYDAEIKAIQDKLK